MRPALAAFLLLALGTTRGDDTPDAARTAKVRELLDLTGSAEQAKESFDLALESFARNPDVDPEFLARLRESFRREEFVDRIVPIYLKHLDGATLDAAIAFYRSPEGRRFAGSQMTILREVTAASREWGVELARKAREALERDRGTRDTSGR